MKERPKVSANYISVKVCDELYDLVDKEAAANSENLIDVVVRALAEHFRRPDLGKVPRNRRGRKRAIPA